MDLRDQRAVHRFGRRETSASVFGRSKVGGIHANNAYKADFLYDNLVMQANVIEGSRLAGVEKLLLVVHAFIPTRHATHGGRRPLEWCAAHQRTVRDCQDRRIENVRRLPRPTRLQLHQCHAHKSVRPRRQLPSRKQPRAARDDWRFRGQGLEPTGGHLLGSDADEGVLHVDDLAQACLHLMDVHDEGGWVNVGTGKDVTIRTLAETVAATVGYEGTIAWDTSKPDGTPRKLLDVSKMTALGWTAPRPWKKAYRRCTKNFKLWKVQRCGDEILRVVDFGNVLG